MILAAGRGERLRPLTDHCPKPLLPVHGKPLMQYLIESLVASGIRQLVINLAHLGEQIEAHFGDGGGLGAEIQYSHEAPALETAGGIQQALPLLGTEPFLVVSGDLYLEYPFAQLPREPEGLAHLVLVPNPPFHPGGDFGLQAGRLSTEGPQYNFAGLGVYRPEAFAGLQPGYAKLGPLLRQWQQQDRVSAELFQGCWRNVGTLDELQALAVSLGERTHGLG